MALYTIGDLHLSFAKDKPMDVFGAKWLDHAEKLRQGFSSLKEDDLTVLCGDLSWGMSLEETEPDFRFVDALPGKKLVLKGNHDYWWTTAARMKRFFAQEGIVTIDILHNNAGVTVRKTIEKTKRAAEVHTWTRAAPGWGSVPTLGARPLSGTNSCLQDRQETGCSLPHLFGSVALLLCLQHHVQDLTKDSQRKRCMFTR